MDSMLRKKLPLTHTTNLHHHCKKRYFLYSAVSSALDRSKRFTLILPWQTCSFRNQLYFSGNHSSHAAITCEHCSFTFPPPSIAKYSFIQLSELGHCGENKKWQNFDTVAKGGFEPMLSWLRVRHSAAELPCSTHRNKTLRLREASQCTVWVWADRPCNHLATGQSAGGIGVGTILCLAVFNLFTDLVTNSNFCRLKLWHQHLQQSGLSGNSSDPSKHSRVRSHAHAVKMHCPVRQRNWCGTHTWSAHIVAFSSLPSLQSAFNKI